MEHEAFAQSDRPELAVVLDNVAFDHLALGLLGVVEARESVEHQKRVVSGDIGGCVKRVENGEVLQHARSLCDGGGR